jgi:methyltransferase (TIGR00027 family)
LSAIDRDAAQSLIDPKLLTALLRESVPALAAVKWELLESNAGVAKCLLPLTYESTNQHGTHQAAMISLAADFVAGVALGTLIPTVPIVGVHPQTDDEGAALWGANITIDYKIPSSADLTISAAVPEVAFARVPRRFFGGLSVLETVPVTCTADGEIVATGSVTVMMRRAKDLKPQKKGSPANVLYRHKLKSSARLIAALRAMERKSDQSDLEAEWSEIAAGPHGRLLAKRFLERSPQLQSMVAGRTQAADQMVRARKWKQLVIIGVGLDLRPFRLQENLQGTKVFEVDLPAMLDERAKVLSVLKVPKLQRVSVGVNLEVDDIADELTAHGFDAHDETLFLIEGVSMYLKEATLRELLGRLLFTSLHPDSRVWLDAVHSDVVAKSTPYAEVHDFLAGIERLGEPFLWGVDTELKAFTGSGAFVESDTASDNYHPSTDPIFDLYRFYVLRRANS